MTSESESSLPTHHSLQTFRSSPPTLPSITIQKMDSKSRFKSEPPATQDEGATHPLLSRVSTGETERPPSAQPIQGDADGSPDTSEDDEMGEDNDPAEKIVDFDWEELHARYHEAINKCHEGDAALMQEWESLMSYFRIWAEAGHEHETSRTYSRLQTRSAYVQNSEEKLEKTRKHYTNVVRAFESALNLLKASGFNG
ncbi:hypothetical protein P153DRAFT_364194 [Dothidotthia symphoricarpi CBS 119687]|uniref:Uncharacterized protein n=1 Tax=Dothidotthia symphoricarpi CBS 119687 TaxID=1392245 RepID=A0A6A6AMC2_9PLEO|nr:uncharacterized protein P153DRAFT_364194 [Dothidotthia symphoricarpi CBS 119687]KAF2132940.1 hypothetical protein P153DRAFT_364194 [Dothidotthia symphoricarpi CBS 119687]